jgi:cathepsin D
MFLPDGLMGMAFSEISVFKTNTVFEILIAQGGATVSQFSSKLAANDSELFLGGSNPSLFTGEFTTVNVTELVRSCVQSTEIL